MGPCTPTRAQEQSGLGLGLQGSPRHYILPLRVLSLYPQDRLCHQTPRDTVLLAQRHPGPHITPQKPPKPQQPDSYPISQTNERPAQPALTRRPHIPTLLPRPGASTLTETPQRRQALWALSPCPGRPSPPPPASTRPGVGWQGGWACLQNSLGGAQCITPPLAGRRPEGRVPLTQASYGVWGPWGLAQAEQEGPTYNVHLPVGGVQSAQSKPHLPPKTRTVYSSRFLALLAQGRA